MIFGISAQIIFGNLTGLARIYELHIIFKCLTAASCALMYTSGSVICEFKIYIFLKNLSPHEIFPMCLCDFCSKFVTKTAFSFA